MNFQYFFFDTYIGYFLQVLPIALMVSAMYGFIRFKKDKETHIEIKLFKCIFVCYITGLVCLVVGLDLIKTFWFELFYPVKSGIAIDWFSGVFDIIPDFYNNLNSETIGNILMFLPFGFLYSLSHKKATWKNCVVVGVLTVVIIEILQPIFGRAFDLNDIILNSLGIIVSTSIFRGVKKLING